MLALTKKTSYGLVAMAHLARLEGGQVASAQKIADLFGVPTSLLMNVLKELAAAGYVESVRGMHGGYRLARRPEEINLADLVTSIEGPIRLAECVKGEAGGDTECSVLRMARCPVADPVHRVQRRINDFLRKMTLAEIVDVAPALLGHLPAKEESNVG